MNDLCWDCKERKGIYPVVLSIEREVFRICQLCFNKWRPFMHRTDCECEHCEYCKEVVESCPT